MPDPISYIKNSSGTVNAALVNELSDLYGEGLTRALASVSPLHVSFDIPDHYISATTGGLNSNMSSNDECSVSDYVPIKGYDVVEAYTAIGATGLAIAFYDSSKTYIEDSGIPGTGFTPAWYKAVVPEDAYFVRMSCYALADAPNVSRFFGRAYVIANRDVQHDAGSYNAVTAMRSAVDRLNGVNPPGGITINPTDHFRAVESGALQSLEGAGSSDLVYVKGCTSIDVHARLSDSGYVIALFDANGLLLPNASLIGTNVPMYTSYHLDLTGDDMANVCYAEFNDYNTPGEGHDEFRAMVNGVASGDTARGRHFGTFSIIGDSYSTFTGYTLDDAKQSWYPQEGNDVKTVENTWWWKFANAYGSRMIENNSWNGSTIGYRGYSGVNSGKESSFISRDNLFTTPELVLIFGGTNDVWAARDTSTPIGTFLGEYKYSDWTDDDLNTFRPALAKLIDDIQHKYVGVYVIFILNTDIDTIDDSVKTVCAHYGVPVLELAGIGKDDGHPNIAGMQAICDQLTSFLEDM